ncbi:MAG: hypothetical protein U0136_13845 [Bdellovibrionota bacterium]
MLKWCSLLGSFCKEVFGHTPRTGSEAKVHVQDLKKMLMGSDEEQVSALAALAEYWPQFKKAFPLPGEIEGALTYVMYMSGSLPMDWTLLIFRDHKNRVLGGLHFQILDVDGVRYAWCEHWWLTSSELRAEAFLPVMSIIREEMVLRNVDAIFLEFNDPVKMTPEEVEIDKSAGLGPEERLWFWANMRAMELVVPTESRSASRGKIVKPPRLKSDSPEPAPYAQPAMSEEDPPVEFLTLAFIAVGKKLAGTTLDRDHYQRLLDAAHGTITGCDPSTDETCVKIREAIARCPETLVFRPLRERFEKR